MEVLRVQTTFTSSNVASPPDATAGFSYEGYIAIGDVRFSSLGIVQRDTLFSNLESYTQKPEALCMDFHGTPVPKTL